MSKLSGFLLFASVLLTGSQALAQSRDAFVEATVHLLQAVDGEFGDEGRYASAAVDAMGQALADWDADIARAEARLTADAAAAPPETAARIHAVLAAAYLERGRFDRAQAHLDQSTRLAPDFGDAHLLRGLVLDRLGRAEAAEAAYREGWRRHAPGLAAAYRVALAPAATEARRAEAAAAAHELLAAVGGADETRRLVFPTDAFFDDAAAKAPLFALARYAPGFALLQQGKYDDAVAALRRAVAADPLLTAAAASPELLAGAGALRAGDFAGAVEQLSDAVAATPASGEAHRVLGLAYQASGDVPRALEQLTAAVRLEPGDERARLGLAAALGRAGRTAEVREALRDAAQALPASGQLQWRLGQVAVSAGDWPAAVAAFDAAASLRPLTGSGALHAARASVRTRQTDIAAAMQAYRDRVAAVPHESAAHLDLSGAYRAAGLVDAALVECLAAALLDRSSAAARAACGQILAGAGRDAEAVILLQSAVALDPRDREGRYALSQALARLGRADEAAEHLRVYEELRTATGK